MGRGDDGRAFLMGGDDMARLSDRDKRFADEYMIDFDAKNAAIRAGYSPKTAKDAYKWIDPDGPKKPAIREEIERRMARAARRTGVTVERIEAELARIAFADISDVVDLENAKLLEDVEHADTAAVMSVRMKIGDGFEERELKMYDKLRALELLGKRRGMFEDKLKLAGPVPVIIDDTPQAPEQPTAERIGFE